MEFSHFLRPLSNAIKRSEKERKEDVHVFRGPDLVMQSFDYICNELRDESLMLKPMTEKDYDFVRGLASDKEPFLQFIG